MTQVVAIPAEKLGILEAHIQQMINHKLKRDRRQAFNRISRIINDLGLNAELTQVKLLGFAVTELGDLVAILSDHTDTRVDAGVGS